MCQYGNLLDPPPKSVSEAGSDIIVPAKYTYIDYHRSPNARVVFMFVETPWLFFSKTYFCIWCWNIFPENVAKIHSLMLHKLTYGSEWGLRDLMKISSWGWQLLQIGNYCSRYAETLVVSTFHIQLCTEFDFLKALFRSMTQARIAGETCCFNVGNCWKRRKQRHIMRWTMERE